MDIIGTSSIVTGGASGLGAATVRLLTSHGARTVVLDIQDDKGAALAKEVDGIFVHADVANSDQVIAAVEAAKTLGPLRTLVNCAGILRPSRTIGRDGTYESAHDLGSFTGSIQTNLIGTFNCIRLAATAMSQTQPLAHGERGAIVNTSSLAAFDGQIGQAAYSASKGGIVGMTLPIARDLAVVGIRVNTIAPGIIDTPIYGSGETADTFKANLTKDIVFPPRLGEPDEFASLALELLSNSYMNGETVRFDAATRLQPR